MKTKTCLVIVLAFLGCSSIVATAQEPRHQPSSTLSLEQAWELTGLSQPESVLSIPGHPWLYVSNVNGEEPGFVSRLSRDGKLDALKWVEGITTPTGMAFFEGKIYVVDQTQVHAIDPATGKIVKTISSEAKTLNDISFTADGRALISDLTTGSIYSIEGDQAVLWLKSSEFPTPNGMLVQGSDLIVGNVGSVLSRKLTPDQLGALYRVNISTKAVQQIASTAKTGSYDGVASYRDGIISSDPLAGKVFYTTANGHEIVKYTESGIADLGVEAESNTLYAPWMFENKIVAYTIKTQPWKRINTKAEYLELAADKYFGETEGKSVATSDGKIKGKFGGRILAGTWEWKDGMFCRTSTLGDLDLGYDCLVIDVTETKMRLTLGGGKRPSVVYERQAAPVICQLVKFNIKPEHVEAFKKAARESLVASLKEPGNKGMTVYEVDSEPGVLYVLSNWKDQAAIDFHGAQTYNAELRKLAETSLMSSPEISRLSPIEP